MSGQKKVSRQNQAKVLNVPIGTVKSCLARARFQMGEKLRNAIIAGLMHGGIGHFAYIKTGAKPLDSQAIKS